MNKLLVTVSPHIFSKDDTRKLMGRVCIACIPACLASCLIFGWQCLFLQLVSAAACVGFEAVWNLLMKKDQTVGDLSAVVTGLLLAFNVPANLPIWMLIIGDAVAIIAVKQLFGGLGFNFANPAIVARIVLSLSFTAYMSDGCFPANKVDALATATPLAVAATGTRIPLVQLFLGTHGGVMGETCAIALILGGIYLMLTATVSPAVPLSTLAGVILMCILCGKAGQIPVQLLSGGLLLGAFYMATDYVTSPYTVWGKVIYGLGIGILTSLIRFYSTSAEGVSYAILLMNIVTPYINRGIRQRPLGVKRPKKEAAKA